MKTKVIVVMLLAMLGLNVVSANELYLDQSGDASTIIITQEGMDNRIGTLISPIIVYGDSVSASITQQGSSNELDMTINGSAASVTLSTIGSTNIQTVTCGTISTPGCSGATINTTIQGDNNNIIQSLGSGSNQRSVINVTGDFTNVTHNATGGSHKADITVNSLATAGAPNNITLNQSGAIMQQSTINASGSGININVTQSPQ